MPSTKRKTDYTVRTIFSADDRLTKSLRTIVGRGVRTIRGLASASKTAAIGIAGIGAAGAGAAYGVYRLTRSYSESVDALDEQATAIGMSAQALREWQGVAERNGMTAEQMTSAFGKMNNAVSKAREGTGSLGKTLKEHLPGVYKQIKAAKSNEEAQAILFRAIRAVDDEMDRGRLASEAFGKGVGQRLLPVIMQGDKAIDGMRGNVKRLRGELTAAEVGEASKFEDQLLDTRDAALALRDAIGSELVRAATPALKELTSWLTENRAEIAAKIADGIKGMATELAKVDWKDIAGTMLEAFRNIDKVMGGIVRAARFLSDPFGYNDPVNPAEDEFAALRAYERNRGKPITPIPLPAAAPLPDMGFQTGPSGGITSFTPMGASQSIVRVVVESTKDTLAKIVSTSTKGPMQVKAQEHNTGARGVAR